MKYCFLCCLVLISACLSSCAYVQTRKQIEELGCEYEGKQLSVKQGNKLNKVYHQGNTWYLAAENVRLKKSYPLVHDSVLFTGNNAPEYRKIENSEEGISYHPISAGTAAVLQRGDGYATTDTLAAELTSTPGAWVSTLPNATAYEIKAEIPDNGCHTIAGMRQPQETPMANQVLGALDFVFIDIPATAAYNAAIPFAAPFVFFGEFIKND